jgi:DNA-binding Xre family transcriptional regulator
MPVGVLSTATVAELPLTVSSSSAKLNQFLEEQNLHKKDFAEMIGVSLSYVYSLIDPDLPFSTRVTTLERIAAVMHCPVSHFVEYKSSEDPAQELPSLTFLKQQQEALGLSNLQFFKSLPRTFRTEAVEVWRGASPLPLDWSKLQLLCQAVKLENHTVFTLWESRLKDALREQAFDSVQNQALYQAMLSGVKTHLNLL